MGGGGGGRAIAAGHEQAWTNRFGRPPMRALRKILESILRHEQEERA
jgi:hypothetical protein